MFEIGDYVVYGSTGICQIVNITTMDMPGVSKNKRYYVLKPCHQAENTIFVSVETKTIMRNVMKQEEAEAFINKIPEIEELWISNEKLREQMYKECMSSCQSRDWIRIIKTMYLRKKERLDQGKKITATDERYLKLAEENLYTELSIPLKIPKEDVAEYICSKISYLENTNVNL